MTAIIFPLMPQARTFNEPQKRKTMTSQNIRVDQDRGLQRKMCASLTVNIARFKNQIRIDKKVSFSLSSIEVYARNAIESFTEALNALNALNNLPPPGMQVYPISAELNRMY